MLLGLIVVTLWEAINRTSLVIFFQFLVLFMPWGHRGQSEPMVQIRDGRRSLILNEGAVQISIGMESETKLLIIAIESPLANARLDLIAISQLLGIMRD